MDDLHLIRELYTAPAPSDEVDADARARLTAAYARETPFTNPVAADPPVCGGAAPRWACSPRPPRQPS